MKKEKDEKKTNSQTIDAIVIFTDIRGFTDWSQDIEVFQHSPELIYDFYKSLEDCFSGWNFKPLGDGALLVKKMDPVEIDIINREIENILCKIAKTEEAFITLCDKFSEKRGQPTELKLGWGITRGSVNEICTNKNIDYIGANINKASRLCDLARPFGIVIDKADFRTLPQKKSDSFFTQTRILKSIIKPVEVWVTKEIYTTFLTRENLKETPEVHVAGICYRQRGNSTQVLLARRNNDRELFPGLIEGCGGQLRHAEKFTQGVERHFQTEMKIKVEVLENVHMFYDIQAQDKPYIPGIVFLCKHIEGEPNSKNHSKTEWVDLKKIETMDEKQFIKGIKNEIIQLFEIKQRQRNVKA